MSTEADEPATALHELLLSTGLPHDLAAAASTPARLRATVGIRELARLLLVADADQAGFEDLADGVDALVARLREVPERVPAQGERNALLGRVNVLAPPLDLDASDPDVYRIRTTLGVGFGGPEGLVHGGVVAEIFDAAFGAAQARLPEAAVTAMLEVRYVLGTPLDTPLLFETRVDRVEGRKTFMSAQVSANGEVTATATALFLTPRWQVR